MALQKIDFGVSYNTYHGTYTIYKNKTARELSDAEEAAVDEYVSKIDNSAFPGGMIVLSTDVNVGVNSLASKIKSLYITFMNRVFKTRHVDKPILKYFKKHNINSGWSVGRLFHGRYYSSKTDQLFNEKSFAVDVRGIPMKDVYRIAIILSDDFKQESVLVVNHKNNTHALISPDEVLAKSKIVTSRRKRLTDDTLF